MNEINTNDVKERLLGNVYPALYYGSPIYFHHYFPSNTHWTMCLEDQRLAFALNNNQENSVTTRLIKKFVTGGGSAEELSLEAHELMYDGQYPVLTYTCDKELLPPAYGGSLIEGLVRLLQDERVKFLAVSDCYCSLVYKSDWVVLAPIEDCPALDNRALRHFSGEGLIPADSDVCTVSTEDCSSNKQKHLCYTFPFDLVKETDFTSDLGDFLGYQLPIRIPNHL